MVDVTGERGAFEWMILPLKRYAEFSGRSRRSEYWWYTLLLVLMSIVVRLLFGASPDPLNPFAFPQIFGGWLSFLLVVATIIPSLGVAVRRLHDRGKSGWWYFILLVPIIGGIVLLVWFCQEGESGPNRFGPDPKGRGVDADVFS